MSKKEVLENQENNKSAEIETLFKKVEKVPYGEVLASVFKDFTEAKEWKLEENELTGKIINEDKPYVMVLTNFHGSLKQVRLEVFDKEAKAKNSSGDVTFLAGPLDVGNPKLDASFNFKPKTHLYSDEYSRFLIKIVGEVSLKYLESRKGSKSAGDGGVGPH